jgi:hypothetical protein
LCLRRLRSSVRDRHFSEKNPPMTEDWLKAFSALAALDEPSARILRASAARIAASLRSTTSTLADRL